MSAQFWDKWDAVFREHVIFKKCDRGYFNKPVTHRFEDKKAIKVLFVQGFGIHWVSDENWSKADLIVLFSAFNNLKDIMLPNRQLDHVVTQLQDQIKDQVYKTMKLFWEELFRSDEPVITIDEVDVQDKKLLISDLDAYYENLVDKVSVNKSAKVILYETQYDDLATHTQLREMKRLFGRINYHHMFDFVGHGFPFTRAMECKNDLNKHVNIF